MNTIKCEVSFKKQMEFDLTNINEITMGKGYPVVQKMFKDLQDSCKDEIETHSEWLPTENCECNSRAWMYGFGLCTLFVTCLIAEVKRKNSRERLAEKVKQIMAKYDAELSSSGIKACLTTWQGIQYNKEKNMPRRTYVYHYDIEFSCHITGSGFGLNNQNHANIIANQINKNQTSAEPNAEEVKLMIKDMKEMKEKISEQEKIIKNIKS